jgi:Mu transposase, C-terminal domain
LFKTQGGDYGWKEIIHAKDQRISQAKVESAVLVAERWILAAVRNHTFFNITQLNEAIAEQLQTMNTRPFKKMPSSRKELFETIDKPALKPLLKHPFQYADWKIARANIDYHVEVDRHFYSVPYQLVREQVRIRLTSTTLEVLFKNRHVARHKRSYVPGGFTTLQAHMPKSHQRYLEWISSRIIKWAEKTGPDTGKLVTTILENRPYPEQGFRSAMGIMRLCKDYTSERVEKACRRALAIGAFSYKSVKSILENGLDQHPLLSRSNHRRCGFGSLGAQRL